MEQIKGVKDLGIFRLVWQPNLLIQVDHEARVLWLQEADVNAVAQAVFGGQAITQVYGGKPFFDLVVRFLQEF
jgi:heavy metal efflux system protein